MAGRSPHGWFSNNRDLLERGFMDNVERLTFQDGSWWDIKTLFTRGMRKRLDMVAQKAIPYDKAKEAGVNLENPDELKNFILRQPEYLASSAIDDQMLLMGTVGFSYGMVTLDVIDNAPDENVKAVLKRLNEVWYPSREKMADFFVKR